MNVTNASHRPSPLRIVPARFNRWPWSTPAAAAAPTQPQPQSVAVPVPVASAAAPEVAEERSPQAAPAPAPRSASTCARLLVVDDEKMIAQNLQRLLSRRGYDVEAFTDPLEARDRFEAAPEDFDLVISDLAMPGLRGEDLAGSILQKRPQVPVLIYTGFLDTAAQNRLDALHVRRVLSKPTPLSEIAEIIAQELSGT